MRCLARGVPAAPPASANMACRTSVGSTPRGWMIASNAGEPGRAERSVPSPIQSKFRRESAPPPPEGRRRRARDEGRLSRRDARRSRTPLDRSGRLATRGRRRERNYRTPTRRVARIRHSFRRRVVSPATPPPRRVARRSSPPPPPPQGTRQGSHAPVIATCSPESTPEVSRRRTRRGTRGRGNRNRAHRLVGRGDAREHQFHHRFLHAPRFRGGRRRSSRASRRQTLLRAVHHILRLRRLSRARQSLRGSKKSGDLVPRDGGGERGGRDDGVRREAFKRLQTRAPRLRHAFPHFGRIPRV